MEKKKLKTLIALAAAYLALTVGLAYAIPTVNIASVTASNAPNLVNVPADISMGVSNINVNTPASQPLPDSASIVLYHVGYGFYKWAEVTLTYTTAPQNDVTWRVTLYIYNDTDANGQLSSGDQLVSVSDEGIVTITAGTTSASTIVALHPAVHYTQVSFVELYLSP